MMRILIFMFFVLSFNSSFAQTSDNASVALFVRCFSKITQNFPGLEERPLIEEVKNGLDPLEKCLQLFSQANLTPNENKTEYNLQNNSRLGKAILNNFNDLHFSWFSNNTFPSIGNGDEGGKSIFDHQASALYFTRAVFGQGVKFQSIFEYNKNLQGKRTPISPYTSNTAPFSGASRNDFLFSNNASFNFAERGELTGIKDIPLDLSWPWSFESSTGTKSGIAYPGKHFGGGLLGSQIFLMTSTQIIQTSYRTDGGVLLPRNWAKFLLRDVLCREIPAIRLEDIDNPPNGEEFVVQPQNHPTAPFFRNSRACARCHATIDRMTYAIRGYSTVHQANFKDGNKGAKFLDNVNINLTSPLNYDWQIEPDPDFHRKNDVGATFYFRESKGELINRRFDDLNQLGGILKNTLAPYSCIAKRYFEYFVGENIVVEDIGYDNLESTLDEKELEMRNFVLGLAQSLQSDPNQNVLNSVIAPIIRSKYFKDTP